MTLIQAMTPTLNDKNNATNVFRVPENIDVQPLFVFIWALVTEIWRIFTFCTILVAAILNMKDPIVGNTFLKTFFGKNMDPYELIFDKIAFRNCV